MQKDQHIPHTASGSLARTLASKQYAVTGQAMLSFGQMQQSMFIQENQKILQGYLKQELQIDQPEKQPENPEQPPSSEPQQQVEEKVEVKQAPVEVKAQERPPAREQEPVEFKPAPVAVQIEKPPQAAKQEEPEQEEQMDAEDMLLDLPEIDEE